MTKPTYNCTQQELYTIATLAWNSCGQHLALFTGFKPKYIASYITDNLDGIEITKQLPDDMQRTAAAKANHTQLIAQAESCRALFQRLKRYIASAWPSSQHNTYYDAAGQSYYAGASNDNWDAIEGLLNSAVAFTDTYESELLNNDNMPPAFPGILASARSGFAPPHQSFLNNEETASIQAEVKVEANNALHTALMSMMLDGQEIFRTEPAIRNQFIFDHCLFLVRGAGTAGVRGTVTDSATTLPIAGATITVGANEYSTISEPNGHYEISPAAAGTYTINVTAPGYLPLTIPSHQILTGTISTLNLLLNPEP
ncbi:MAG: carboxypeptidase-like regulatory domain-containing protein [Bacteroidia bacterium]